MKAKLAIDGGAPVRATTLPYARQQIDAEDIASVTQVLTSDWLTTGPKIGEFEEAFAATTGAAEAVAVSSGTAALHAAVHALDIGPGDEVIVTPMTFAASANVVVYQGGTPVFADIEAETLLIDPATVEAKITPRTKAIVAVDYAGQPCDWQALRGIAKEHGLALIDDACHAIGGADANGRSVGTLADLNTFSLHPAKHLTTGEGGVIATDDAELAARMRVFRNHGITTDHRQRAEAGSFFYEMVTLGYNYRLTDFQAALGLSQLQKLSGWVTTRQQIAAQYDAMFSEVDGVRRLTVRPGVSHAYHLYVVRLDLERLKADRAMIFQALRAEGIGVNVHYIPVHFHPFYRQNYGTQTGDCPVAERVYTEILSLPMFPSMRAEDIRDVVHAFEKVLGHYAR